MSTHDFTLVIGNKNYSSWSLRPWVLMKAANIPFKEIIIPLDQPETKTAIQKYSPNGRVPCLLWNDRRISESLAICETIADIFPEKTLWPKDVGERAVARSIANEMHSGFTDLRNNLTMNCRKLVPGFDSSPAKTDIARITQIWSECRNNSKTRGNFLFGDFGVADAMFAPVVFRFKTYDVKLEGLAKDYYHAMLDHPAMSEWLSAGKSEVYVIPKYD